MTPPKAASQAAPDLSILGTSVSVHPGLDTLPISNSTINENSETPILEHGPHFRTSPLDFLRKISLYVSGEGWRSYDNYIGQSIFYPGFSEDMSTAVMASPLLKAKIKELVNKRVVVEETEGLFRKGEQSYEKRLERRRKAVERQLEEVAEKLTDEMICKMESKLFIRGACYIASQLLTRTYHQGIHVSSEEIVRLLAVAEEAKKNRQSIIFLPNHRSHVDYIALQVICFRLGLALPTVVAGDNLNFPLIGPFMQHAGAMWIRRSFGDDQLYVTLVQSYIDVLLQKGLNFECFIEGGRSRIGKLLPPKFGILSFLLDSVLSGRVEDAIICPVSTQYDKVIEVDSYISELLGMPKPKENLSQFLSASSVLSLKLGRVDVRFHETWSLKSFIQEQQVRLTSLSDSQQAQLEEAYRSNLRIRLLRTLGYKILSDINAVSVVMPTSLIGTVLLTLRGRGVGKAELVQRVEWLGERIRAQGGRVAHFAGHSTDNVVERGLEVLGPQLVKVQKDLAEETYSAVDNFQLSFYRNMTIHLFISQAIVSVAIHARLGAYSGGNSHTLAFADLVKDVEFLSQLFRDEFIFLTAGLTENLGGTLAALEKDSVIDLARDEANNVVAVNVSEVERQRGSANFDFFSFLLWPFIETYWLGAVSLIMLMPHHSFASATTTSSWLNASMLLSYSQLLGKTLFAQGDLSYFESVNKETLKNAFARFEKEGMLLIRKPPKGAGPMAQMVKIADDWISLDNADGHSPAEAGLWKFCDSIDRFRMTRSTNRHRLSELVETLRGRLWNEAVVNVGLNGGQAADAEQPVQLAQKAENKKTKSLSTKASL